MRRGLEYHVGALLLECGFTCREKTKKQLLNQTEEEMYVSYNKHAAGSVVDGKCNCHPREADTCIKAPQFRQENERQESRLFQRQVFITPP